MPAQFKSLGDDGYGLKIYCIYQIQYKVQRGNIVIDRYSYQDELLDPTYYRYFWARVRTKNPFVKRTSVEIIFHNHVLLEKKVIEKLTKTM